MRIETPLGPCRLDADEQGLIGIRIETAPTEIPAPAGATGRHLDAAAAALGEYFDGQRRHFDDLVLAPRGSDFQREVWRVLLEIPFGETRSYGEIAERVGRPGAARAVGGASHENPLWVVIPCHRVVGANGKLTGYAGGLDRKAWLLAHEGARPAELPFAAAVGTAETPRPRP